MKKILVLVSSLFLVGCASNPVVQAINSTVAAAQNFTISQQQLDAARSSYDGVVLAPMHKYAQLPRCKTGQSLTINNPCHSKVLLKKLRTVDKQIEIAFSNTQSRIDTGDNSGAGAAYNTLTEAINTAKALINQTGVTVLGF